MEKRQEKERDSSKKEHTTKLITPQVAKIEHTYRPGKCKHEQNRNMGLSTGTWACPAGTLTLSPTLMPPPGNRHSSYTILISLITLANVVCSYKMYNDI